MKPNLSTRNASSSSVADIVEGDKISIRPVLESDRGQIIKLCSNIFNLDAVRLERIWTWLFDRNPAACCLPLKGWVLEIGDRVVGHTGIVPQIFLVNRISHIFSFTTCYCVMAEYRGHGIKLARKFLNGEDIRFPITNSANSSARQIYRFLGCKDIPDLSCKSCIFLINAGKLLQFKLRAVQNRQLSLVINVLAPILTILSNSIMWMFCFKGSSSYVVKRYFDVGDSFDELGKELQELYPICSLRSSEYLRWRYFQHPEITYQLYGAENANGKLCGYAVGYSRKHGGGLTVFNILDIFCDHEDATLINALVKMVVKEARGSGADAVRMDNIPSRMRQALFRNGFLPFKSGHAVLYKSNDQELEQAASGDDSWYCPDGDGDAGIWPHDAE